MRGRATGAGTGMGPGAGSVGAGPPSLATFARGSSLHGLDRAVSGRPGPRRWLWALSLATAAGLLAALGTERLSRYLHFPHLSRRQWVSAANLTFPAVTICNFNPLRLSRLRRNDLFHAGEMLELLERPRDHRPRAPAALRRLADFSRFQPQPFSLAELADRAGHCLQDMLLMCSFRGHRCSHRNFSTVSNSCTRAAPVLGDLDRRCISCTRAAQRCISCTRAIWRYISCTRAIWRCISCIRAAR